ncbi:MBG domain-containing protein [Flavobacterium succinicans]|uniref:UDP-N-acetylglucosamine transferase n=1 Tax=Flavobacterium succinicans TaxID=29536 RepID=A0A199XMF1_9FLAO|nr:MBG domain-containing protein [Flavobacterium succinicans]OAZ02840.1 UDP-N-acetylglucosamine transferase [Flavobacterium succinicans]
MKKHLHYVLLFLFLACSLQAQVVGWNQPTSGTPTVFSIGTSTSGVEVGRSICIDAAGNTYVYGIFSGTADFDPSGASTTATASGTGSDLFIAKYNAAGVFQWVANGGVTNSSDNNSGNLGSIKTDGTNVYVVGSLAVSSNGATFTPVGSCTTCTVPSNATTTRGFVGKLDAATGTWQWINTFGGNGLIQNNGQGLCLDPTGNVYVSGQCNGTFTLGALPQISTADPEVFFGKLNAAGTWQWATTAGGTGSDGAGISGSGITYNTNLDRLTASGVYNSTTAASFGSLSIGAAGGNNDIFLTELNPTTGDFLSAFGFGGTGASEDCGGIVYDPNTTDIFLAGQMSGSLTLPGFGTLAQASASGDIFVGRFTPNATAPNGVFSWAKSFGLSSSDRAYDIATNANGNIYIAGWFSGAGTIDFGSGAATQVTSTGPAMEIFVAALTVGGTGVWAVQGTDNGSLLDQARGVCAAQNTSGTVYATGQFNTGPVSWTPSSNGNVISLSNAGGIGGQDVWVGKIYGATITGTILTSGTTTAFTSCAGSVSTAQNFTVSGSELTANITVTAPTGFEVSLTADSGYASSITLTQTGGTVATTTVYVRLSATATGTPSGNVSCTSTGATTQNVAVSGSVTSITLTAVSQTNVACNGGSTGAATVNAATGGTGPYTYNWTPGNPTGDGTVSVTGLTAGTWTCTVTDANGCSTSRNFTITQPTALTATAISQTNVSCFGGSNGAASINTPTGGTPGYTYNWTPGNPTGDGTRSVTGLIAGNWTCTITDSNDCTTTVTFTITEPGSLNVTAASQTNVSCFGNSNGAASVNTPTGGTPGYTYNWTPGNPTGDGTASVTGLVAGTWTCTVTDANGCTANRSFTITHPTAINATAGSQINVSCYGGSNGSATISPSGGVGPYTYSWSPSGGTAATATGLSAGNYTVTVTDANSCTATRGFTITQPTAISTSTSSTNVSCNGGSNGSAIVTPSGGAGGYTYSWSPSGGTAATATGLSAGSYTVTVTDANSCTVTRNFTITQPTALNATAGSQINVSCNGGSNGSATVTPSGGVGPYTYSWSPSGGTAATATGLAAGNYTVTVTDANSCTATRSFTITQPTALSVTPASQTNVSCFGGSNGAAAINTPTGGAGGYTYNWTPGTPTGDGTTSVTGLVAGTWTCTVTDANGCTSTQNFTITQPPAISVTPASQTNVSCFGGSNGAAAINTPTGGAGGYTYNWTPGTPTGDGTTSVTGLVAGTWTCTVTDANGCTSTQNFTITQPPAISVTPASQTNVSCFGGSNGAATINTPTGGAGGYTYDWTPGNPTGDGTRSVTGLSAGTWTCTVTDANGCTRNQNFTITQPTALNATAGSQINVSCNGGSNGSASVTPSGGVGPYLYSWSPSGGTAATATGLSAGSYTVTITDTNACTATRNFIITQPTALTATAGSQANVSCNGGSNGSASVTPSGGVGPYTYSWSPSGGTAATATGLSAGNYTVTVTDANSCTATRSFTITQPTAISTATGSQTNLSCNGGSNGSATVTPSGGVGPYTYSWSPSGGTAATATGLAAGSYTVTVTDANSCTATRNFTITQPTGMSMATGSQTNVSCNGGSNGSATVMPSGGAGGYTYSWSPSGGTAATATGLSAGTYTVTVTDANSCTATRDFTITQPTAIDFTTTVLPDYDYNNGYSQTIVTSRGTGTKTYAVTAGSLPSGFSLSTAGEITGISTQIADSNFTVTATDANGCTATYNYVLKLNQIPITVTATPSQTKVYGESDPVLTYTVSPSLLSGDSFTGSLTRVSGEDIGNYAIDQGSLSAGSKYLITYVGANLTITAKPITVTATPSQTKVYGATDPVFVYSVSPSLVGSDSFTGALSRVAGENTGTYTINQGSLSAGSNYTISYAAANFTITAKPITVTATSSQTKVYGTSDPVFAYTVSPNLVGSDTFTGALSRVAGENTGNYTITQGNLSSGSNYTITYVSKDFVITAKPITVTADASQTKVYGSANPVYSYTFSPSLVSGDSFTGTLLRTAGEDIGNYAITQGSLSAGSNYTITYIRNDFTITAKPITVTANASQTKVYGTIDPVFTYTVSPSLVSGDSFTGALTRVDGVNVGAYPITQGSLSAGSNYTILYNGSNFTITKADQAITWNQTLGLGCNGETSLVMTAVASSGLAVNYTSSNPAIASVSNKSVLFQNYGSATITASQPGNMNYNAAPPVVLPVVASQPNLIRKQFENIIFFDNSSTSFKSYSWYKNGVLVPGQTSQYFKESGALNGTYYAVATKLDGTLITTCPLTLSPSVEDEYIRIVPNPVRSNASFQLTTNVSSGKLQNARVELFNLIGNLLTTINTSQNTIDMIAPSVEGLYIVKMTLTNGKYFTKNLLVKN